MATVSRQPFAPLDGARLQTLTSIKNRQNSLASTPPSAGKRKARDLADGDDLENVDPVYTKRAKASPVGFLTPSKPSSVSVKHSPVIATPRSLPASTPTPLFRARPILQKTPITKSSTTYRSSPLSSPTGRSPIGSSKRTPAHGHTHRRALSSLSRVNSPYNRSINSVKAAPFSLSSALQGTISHYSGGPKTPSLRSNTAPAVNSSISLVGNSKREIKASWDFVIYEDTPQEHATNMLQHSTCTLDLSSDDENEIQAKKDLAEGRDKENIPPPVDDDVTIGSRATSVTSASADNMVIETSRTALSDLNATDFWADGCDESSVFIIPADEDETAETESVASESVVVSPAEEDEEETLIEEATLVEPESPIRTVEDIMSEPSASKSPDVDDVEEDIEDSIQSTESDETQETFAIWESESDPEDNTTNDVTK